LEHTCCNGFMPVAAPQLVTIVHTAFRLSSRPLTHTVLAQLTAIDGRRATVVLPNDPELVDILARNGVDISVSEGEQQVRVGHASAVRGTRTSPVGALAGALKM
jgi:predicted ATPase